MKDKDFIIFYFDTDLKGNPILDVKTLQECFNNIVKALPDTTTCILLPHVFKHTEWIDKKTYLKKLREEIERVENEDTIDKLNQLGNINPLPAEELKEAMIKDCTTCLHGHYNDHWNEYFCYNPIPCYTWELWELKE